MSVMKPGDFAIVQGQFGFELIEVTSTTPRQFKGNKVGYSRYSRTVRMENCSFFGPEDVTRRLHERLMSSDALCDDDHRKASQRRAKRNAELLAAAELSKTLTAPGDVSNLSGVTSDPTPT